MNAFIRTTLLLLSFTAMTQPVSAGDPATAAAPKRLVIIGASYAAGWGQPTLPGYVVVANKGVGGEDSSQVRARFERDVVAAKPDAVLVWGHINDIHRAQAGKMDEVVRQACENYRLMHAQARVAGIEMILATEVTFSIGDGFLDSIMASIGKLRGKQNYKETVNNRVKSVNAFLRKFAGEHKLQLLDLERAVDSGNGSRREEYDQEDGSHINATGYAVLTAYAGERLR